MIRFLPLRIIDTPWPAWCFLALIGIALVAPALVWPLLAAAAGAGVVFLAWRHLTGFCVLWLVLAGLTMEMTLGDLVDPTAYGITIAVVKGSEIGLAGLCAVRYGAHADPFNPAWVFLIIFALGFVHGLHPGLTPAGSLRSLAGSVAPFLFCFSRLPSRWAGAILRATRWIPLVSVAGGSILDLEDLRPLFVESGGERLAGLGHPAFLAGVTLAAVYACLIRLYRHGRRQDLILLGVNFLILLLTGARAPLAYGVAVTTIAFACVGSPALPTRRRWGLLLGAATLLPIVALLGETLTDIRLFNLLASDGTNLSGRDLLWPPFEQAAAQSAWLGWGLGAGNFIIPPDSALAEMLQTYAAHNEYLRIQVEGGQIGQALLIGAFILWARRHTRPLPCAERIIMLLIFVAFAAHAATDNVLISTSACVLFTFITAVFASAPVGHERGLSAIETRK